MAYKQVPASQYIRALVPSAPCYVELKMCTVPITCNHFEPTDDKDKLLRTESNIVLSRYDIHTVNKLKIGAIFTKETELYIGQCDRCGKIFFYSVTPNIIMEV